jgi:F-type H+-transporting ATPase subunit c
MELKYIAIGCMALGMVGASLGVANVFAALLNGIARNPEAKDKLTASALIGASMSEAMGVASLVVALILIYA